MTSEVIAPTTIQLDDRCMNQLTISRSRFIPVSPSTIWRIVADAGAFHHAAKRLALTEVLAGEGEGLARRCTDHHGGSWLESCVLWEEGHRYRMRVDTATYPLALRLAIRGFEGTWIVEAEGEGSRVTVTFEVDLRIGPFGRPLFRWLGGRGEAEIDEILDGYDSWARTGQPPDLAETPDRHVAAEGVSGGLLRTAITANAAFTATSGFALALGSRPVAAWLGIPEVATQAVGLALLGYAAFLVLVARVPRLLMSGGRVAVAADVAWVVVAAAILILYPSLLAPNGRLGLMGVSVAVLGLAIVQWQGIRRLARDGLARDRLGARLGLASRCVRGRALRARRRSPSDSSQPRS